MLKSQSKVFVFSRDISFLAEAPNFEMKQVKKNIFQNGEIINFFD